MIISDLDFGLVEIDCENEDCPKRVFIGGSFNTKDQQIQSAHKHAKKGGWVIKKVEGAWEYFCCKKCYKTDKVNGFFEPESGI